MDFTLSPEHQEFADSVARFARDKLAPGALERAHSPHYPWETAKLLSEQGLLGFRHGNTMLVIFAGISIVPVKPGHLQQIDHFCML